MAAEGLDGGVGLVRGTTVITGAVFFWPESKISVVPASSMAPADCACSGLLSFAEGVKKRAGASTI